MGVWQSLLRESDYMGPKEMKYFIFNKVLSDILNL